MEDRSYSFYKLKFVLVALIGSASLSGLVVGIAYLATCSYRLHSLSYPRVESLIRDKPIIKQTTNHPEPCRDLIKKVRDISYDGLRCPAGSTSLIQGSGEYVVVICRCSTKTETSKPPTP